MMETATDTSSPFECCECGKSINLPLLEAHIATTHAFYTPYECELCENALLPTDHSLREHYKKIHKMQTFTVKYKVSPELEQRRQLLQQLLQRSINRDVKPKESELQISNLYTSKLLQTCTAMLQKQMAKSTQLLHCDNPAESMKMEFKPTIRNETATKLAHHSAHPDEKPVDFENDGESDESAIDFIQEFGDGDESANVEKQSPSKYRKRKSSNDAGDQQNQKYALVDTIAMDGEMEEEKEEEDVGAGRMVKCVDCGRLVGNYRNSMLIHTSTHHCSQPIFECLGCDKKWYSISARTKEHITTKHGGDQTLLKDNRPALMPLLKSRTAELFPQF